MVSVKERVAYVTNGQEERKKLDLVFIVDCTGSMGGQIEAAKSSIVVSLTSLAICPSGACHHCFSCLFRRDFFFSSL